MIGVDRATAQVRQMTVLPPSRKPLGEDDPHCAANNFHHCVDEARISVGHEALKNLQTDRRDKHQQSTTPSRHRETRSKAQGQKSRQPLQRSNFVRFVKPQKMRPVMDWTERRVNDKCEANDRDDDKRLAQHLDNIDAQAQMAHHKEDRRDEFLVIRGAVFSGRREVRPPSDDRERYSGNASDLDDLPGTIAKPFFCARAGENFVRSPEIGFRATVAIGQLNTKHGHEFASWRLNEPSKVNHKLTSSLP